MNAFGKITERFPLEEGWAIRYWLISDEDSRVVVQVSLSDENDHVAACCFGQGEDVEVAQHMAVLDLHEMVFGGPIGQS